jgi:hypothetical protein
MSSRNAIRPQDLGPDRLKTAPGTPILDPSVEATRRASDLCTGDALPDANRARILAWLAEGAREVTWALCQLPRDRWADLPPARLSQWPALRHAQHLALHQAYVLLPAVRRALGEATPDTATLTTLELEQAEAAVTSAEDIIRTLGETRYELQQRVEAASDEAWPALERPLLTARQRELEHLAVLWKIALNWDRASQSSTPGVPLHPADRLEESH